MRFAVAAAVGCCFGSDTRTAFGPEPPVHDRQDVPVTDFKGVSCFKEIPMITNVNYDHFRGIHNYKSCVI